LLPHELDADRGAARRGGSVARPLTPHAGDARHHTRPHDHRDAVPVVHRVLLGLVHVDRGGRKSLATVGTRDRSHGTSDAGGRGLRLDRPSERVARMKVHVMTGGSNLPEFQAFCGRAAEVGYAGLVITESGRTAYL